MESLWSEKSVLANGNAFPVVMFVKVVGNYLCVIGSSIESGFQILGLHFGPSLSSLSCVGVRMCVTDIY